MGKPDNRKQKKWWQILLLVLGWIVLAIVAVVLFFIIFLSATEFKPAAKMDAKVHGSPSRTVQQGDTLNIMTWNMGFGALGDNADFFMDGGNMVKTADETRVRENVAGVRDELKKVRPDAVFLQEIDIDSDRSYKINEVQTIADSIEGNTPDIAPDNTPSEVKTPQKHTAPAVTIDQVRAVLADKSGEGKTAEVKALLFKYDAGKLSGVKPEDYPALLEEAKKL